MRIGEIEEYLRSLDGGWVNRAKTVDRFIYGDPDAQLTGICVGWMSYQWALEETVRHGCNLFITHEPTFYDHWDSHPESLNLDAAKTKRAFLDQHNLAILRCHDLWDQFPDIGIPDSWAKVLGFGPPIGGKGWYRILDVAGLTVGEVAKRVAGRIEGFKQQAVQVIGDLSRPISRLAIGTGAITPLRHFMLEMGADAALCTDDDFTFWRDGALAIDSGWPVIVVHHPVAEEHGLELLANHLQMRFPEIPVRHIPQKCMYRLISSGR